MLLDVDRFCLATFEDSVNLAIQMRDQSKKTFDGLSEVLGNTPLLSSKHAEWRDIKLEENTVPRGQLPEMCFKHHAVGINVGQHLNCVTKVSGHSKRYSLLTGDLIIMPAGLAFMAHPDRLNKSLTVNLSHELLTRNASELWDIDEFELVPSHPVRDPLIKHIAEALRKELTMNAGGCQIYAKTMANALAVHLLQNFSNRSHKTVRSVRALSSKKLERILDYINDNLEQKIEIEDLAALAQLSQYHFSRAFKQSTGLSPHQYVIQQRVAKARHLLSQQEMTISEVALTCGFTHQSHLNRHFKRLLNITPTEFLNQ